MTKCEDCIDSDIPVIVGQPVFKGDFEEAKCEECGEPLIL